MPFLFILIIIFNLINLMMTKPMGQNNNKELSSTAILTPFSDLSDNNNEKIAQTFKSKSALVQQFPDSGRKQAVIETENLLSKGDTLYGRLQEFVAGFYDPKPILDTIQEHEKYGNDGDEFRSISTAVIGGIEGISNKLNAAVDKPYQIVTQLGKTITSSLNSVGSKIVGLA